MKNAEFQVFVPGPSTMSAMSRSFVSELQVSLLTPPSPLRLCFAWSHPLQSAEQERNPSESYQHHPGRVVSEGSEMFIFLIV